MKKLISIIAIILLLTGSAFAQEWSFGSGQKTASALIATGPGLFYGIAVVTDGTTPVTAISIYNNTTNSGDLIVPTFPALTSSTNRTTSFFVYPPVRFDKGCYADLTIGAGGSLKYVIYIKP
jgi:hypothetical protein